ncbi:hypothetical protein O1611_g2143 [Lasiodiplodia mahajangana]|uniref:Uncharacterized protein n=1 Tax=Lasiodiplodia mahajangana TaxID=1108764 RepID=A0ACC2JWA1_9PEZI|nr:hypothetical protein O1611_g2143 [Lasiodiplodia mahajangana]
MLTKIWGLSILASLSLAQDILPPVVDLGYAKYQGFYDPTYDQNIFRGIRYAAPPVGDLRWQMPRSPAINRSVVLSAENYAPQCPQSPNSPNAPDPSPSGDEDCLFLNVMAPANQTKLPVLVWIHGGGYGVGNNRVEFEEQIRTNGNSYLAVSIAYRLGAFGFLSSADVESFGVVNAGLHDMRFALQWVKKNIQHFGGDPNRVTISGESAGGGSVMMLAMANGGTEGDALFQGIIASSPYLPTQWGFADTWPTISYQAFVKQAGCSDARGPVRMLAWAFIPVTDGKLIRKRPTEQLAINKKVNGLRMLTGNNENEGPVFTPQNITTEEQFINFVLTNYPRLSEQNITSILELYAIPDKVFNIYADSKGLSPPFSTTNSNFGIGWQQAANNLYAETTFVCPSYWMADAFAGTRGKSSWKYQFSVPISSHGADVTPLLADPKTQGTGMDEVFRTAFQQTWGNFVVKGDPTLSPAQADTAGRGSIAAAGTGNWKQWGGRPGRDSLLNMNMTGGMPVTTQLSLGGKILNLTSYVPSTNGSYPELRSLTISTTAKGLIERARKQRGQPGRPAFRQYRNDATVQHRSQSHSTGEAHDTVGISLDTVEVSTKDEAQIDTPDMTTRDMAVVGFLQAMNWMPRWCRYDPQNPPKFTLSMNILLAFSTTFTVANLYYPQPILNVIAQDFHVSYERSSNVATLSQAGYAVGLLFLCPLGDIVPRRPFILFLIFATATMLSRTYTLSRTVTPQLMLPLVGDLAPAHRRASSLSLVVSGLALGLLVARVLSGVVANFTGWRNIYWLALGAQYLTFILLLFTLPDYPAKNKGLNYFKALWKMAVLVVEEPLLVQACLMGFLLSAVFTNFWTTLTFLLASPPYDYSSLEIGLFALIGIAVISLAPVWSRLITDRFVFLFSSVLGLSVELVGILIGTFIGTFTVAGPITQAILMATNSYVDSGSNLAHIANRSNVYSLGPNIRNRVNTIYMVFCFAGQLSGTAAGNRLYAQGGWVWSGSMSIGFIGAAILIGVARGPRESGWVGWKGGWSIKKDENPIEKVEGHVAAEGAPAPPDPVEACRQRAS